LGDNGGAGNLVICEILKIHIDEEILDQDERIDPLKLDIVSRLGENWYGKTNQDSIYEIVRPMSRIGIGIDNIPQEILSSKILTGSDLAMLASVDAIPDKKNTDTLSLKKEEKHTLAKNLLEKGKIIEAWKILT
jgi:hypothetical protein